MSETDAQLARRLLSDVLTGENHWTPDMRLRIATVAQALASLTIVEELRRLNEGRDQWYREVLEVLTEAKEPGETARCTAVSGWLPHDRCTHRAGHTEFVRTVLHEPRACRVCGREGSTYCEPGDGPLTKAQWDAHRRNYLRVITIDDELLAHQQANEHTTKRFGPCPEDDSPSDNSGEF